MRIFKVKWVERFTRQEDIADVSLFQAIQEAEKGTVAADLGGNLIKQRVARQGQGKSGGYRMLIAFRSETRAVYLFGFAKNVRDNITPKQLAALKTSAQEYLNFTETEIDQLIKDKVIFEIEVQDGNG